MVKMTTSYPDEEWRLVLFDGIDLKEQYQVSNYGRLRLFKKNKNDFKVMALALANGYHYYSFKADDTWQARKTRPVHRVVAEAFIHRENDDKDLIIHLDYDKSNNRVENLRWVDRDEMDEHNKNNPDGGSKIDRRKGRVSNSKLTVEQVKDLKKKIKSGKFKLYKLAQEFGITHTQLNRIRSGENWGYVNLD